MLDAATLFDVTELVVIGSAPSMPAYLWPLTLGLFALLILTAGIDAFTARIPDSLVFLGLLIGTGWIGHVASWPEAAAHLRPAVVAGILLWAINLGWLTAFGRDAFGMGDAKWTMLAVFAFGVMPAVYAWGVGACLGVLWLAAAWLVRRPVTRVHFAPFLLAGLIAGLYWLRFY